MARHLTLFWAVASISGQDLLAFFNSCNVGHFHVFYSLPCLFFPLILIFDFNCNKLPFVSRWPFRPSLGQLYASFKGQFIELFSYWGQESTVSFGAISYNIAEWVISLNSCSSNSGSRSLPWRHDQEVFYCRTCCLIWTLIIVLPSLVEPTRSYLPLVEL